MEARSENHDRSEQKILPEIFTLTTSVIWSEFSLELREFPRLTQFVHVLFAVDGDHVLLVILATLDVPSTVLDQERLVWEVAVVVLQIFIKLLVLLRKVARLPNLCFHVNNVAAHQHDWKLSWAYSYWEEGLTKIFFMYWLVNTFPPILVFSILYFEMFEEFPLVEISF